jgi:uncharacterized membrane protein YoaK (UPF0700 family)
MQSLPQNPRSRAKSAVALWLTFAAGMVDIIGYLAVYHLYAAHMTGETVELGHYLLTGDWPTVAKAGAVIACFVGGSLVGRVVIEVGARRRIRSIASVGLLLEALLLGLLIWLGTPLINLAHGHELSVGSVCWLLGLLAAAMGLQTATLTRIGSLTIHTTFVTGMLNKFAQTFSEWLFWLHDESRKGEHLSAVFHKSREHSSFRTAMFVGLIWFFYLLGSVVGTWMSSRWSTHSLYLPFALVILAAGVDQFRPLSLEEEKDQV